ncbi:2-oxoisovalerate dehydrogenase subunit beta [Penicillium herquei]|nr:2-oxoisovalerate dehydrogenase subunit beta [Penicillium herquei]
MALPRAPRAVIPHVLRRYYSGAPSPAAKLNLPIDYKTTSILHHTPSSLSGVSDFPAAATSKRLNLFQAINSALRTALTTSDKVLLFGEDVAFGGVFRCSMDLQTEFGTDRVFNTPLTEQGIAGFAIGAAAEGMKPVAEIQFADYVFPAFDQIVNEAAKFRYREGGTGIDVGGLVIRMPCGAVGHGALYHSQSPEALFAHIPGVRVVMPRSPSQAKGLLLSSIFQHNDPVVFLEPKILYRAAVEHVPNEYYTIPLSKAEVIKPGKDLTIISYGQPLYLCSAAITALEKTMPGLKVELIDLRTIYPWDRQTVLESVRKTGRAVVVHESMINYGVGAEVSATIQEGAFLRLEAPVKRVAGCSTHTGLTYEQFILPDVARIYDAMKQTLEY